MVLQIWLIISLILILLILAQMPKDNIGLTSFSNKLGSPTEAEKKIKILTAIGILLYIIIAIGLDVNV